MQTTPPRTRPPLGLTAQAAGLLVLNWVMVRLWRLDRLLVWLTPSDPPTVLDRERAHEARRCVDGILVRLPKLRGKSCLIRSLALYAMVRRSGFPVQFQCGVRKENGSLDGHAWLTLEGKPFLEPSDPTLVHSVIFSFPK